MRNKLAKKLKPIPATRDNYSYKGFWLLVEFNKDYSNIKHLTFAKQTSGKKAEAVISIPYGVYKKLLSKFVAPAS